MVCPAVPVVFEVVEDRPYPGITKAKCLFDQQLLPTMDWPIDLGSLLVEGEEPIALTFNLHTK